MSEPLRVLIISREPWRDDSNEGSVLTSLFSGQPFTFANLFCKPGLPQNPVCTHYFQLTDRMALDNIVRRKPMGRAFTLSKEQASDEPVFSGEREQKRFYDFFRRHQWEGFFTARQLLWSLADFRSAALTDFVRDFAPDVIFAPLCYDRHILAIQRYVIDLAGCPAATYLYDDIYSLRQFRFSPLFWRNRFALRKAIRATLAKYELAYTMTQEQADAFGTLLHRSFRVLKKCVDLQEDGDVQIEPHALPVRFLYAGGVYYGRDRTLMRIADACAKCGARLDIYTNAPLSRRARRVLDDKKTSFVHAAVPFDALKKRYAESDVAIHVESFRLKQRCITRLSFSSKIADCLSGGCAVLSACAPDNTGLQYLKRMDAAICVERTDDIFEAVRRLATEPALRSEYANKARACAVDEHDATKTRQQLCTALAALSKSHR